MHSQRVLDADADRAAEGLRTLEEVARFLLDDATLSSALKDLRHAVRRALPADLPAWRDSAGDVGAGLAAAGQAPRRDLLDLVRANAARVQEALRALEEFAPLAGLDGAPFGRLRFAAYDLERRLLARLPAWRLAQVRLYALVDTALCGDPLRVADAVAAGGAGAVQLRAKGLPLRALRDLAARLRDAVRAHGALFIVNDRPDLAAALGADGCHLGQDDLPLADARRVVGPLCALGMSVHRVEQLAPAQDGGADYVGLGPMFATATKPHEPVVGPDLLDAVRPRLRVPSFAIGGLDRERLVLLKPRLPHGAAVAGALCRAADPRAAAEDLRRLLDG